MLRLRALDLWSIPVGCCAENSQLILFTGVRGQECHDEKKRPGQDTLAAAKARSLSGSCCRLRQKTLFTAASLVPPTRSTAPRVSVSGRNAITSSAPAKAQRSPQTYPTGSTTPSARSRRLRWCYFCPHHVAGGRFLSRPRRITAEWANHRWRCRNSSSCAGLCKIKGL
ncbi:hypothetical protein B0J12DRAFT_325896 [Macrophomina phaseolina]|uniref:Uncharacterized protein n=1 Tax=Macrophomina phaseolina TaxID=35725 RepID=A0ABQ8FV55_9PEZI|nr:hypothetical protein B0J12DRAFT_325896 [Macrophomina phaseolina]